MQTDGTLCWGHGAYGRLGLGADVSNRTTPQQVGSLTTWSRVSAGGHHTCATRTDGTMWCMGPNGNGQAPAAATAVSPVQAGVATTWRNVSAGTHPHLRRPHERNVVVLGAHNAQGQLGVGDSTYRPTPTAVTIPGGAAVTYLGSTRADTRLAIT